MFSIAESCRLSVARFGPVTHSLSGNHVHLQRPYIPNDLGMCYAWVRVRFLQNFLYFDGQECKVEANRIKRSRGC